MEHIAAIMLLVGCSHGGLTCEELPTPQVAFETMEDCVGALPAALGGAGAGKRIVILSTSGRREEENVRIMASHGFPHELYDRFISAGEDAREALERREQPFHAKLGRR